MPVKFLIKVLDVARIFANNHGSKVFNRTHDRACLPFQRRLSPSEQSILVSNDLDENPVPHFGVHNRGLDLRDLHRSPCVIAATGAGSTLSSANSIPSLATEYGKQPRMPVER